MVPLNAMQISQAEAKERRRRALKSSWEANMQLAKVFLRYAERAIERAKEDQAKRFRALRNG